MITVFELYKNNNLIARFRFWEDSVDFIEELKRLNSYEVDRRDFKVKIKNDIIKVWSRK